MYLPRLTLGTSPPIAFRWLLITGLAFGPWASGADAAARADPAAPADRGVSTEYSEDEVKAAFLFHFATYAEWPAESSAGDPGDEIDFAVLHAPRIARKLERFSEGRTIEGRPVQVRRIRALSQLRGDEVLFIGASQNRRLAQLISEVEGPTLVVTDSEDGLPDGAMINFQLVDRRVRFEIALPAAQRAGLSLSSRLLSAAVRVEMTRCYLECRARDRDGRFALSAGRLRIPSRA